MEQLEKRMSYLRGLADGLEMSETSKEGKMLSEMIELMDDLCASMRELHTRVEENEEFVEAIDEDLSDLEYLLYDDEDDLYETVEDDGEDSLLTGENERDAYDLDDSEDAYVYEIAPAETPENGGTDYEVAYEIECPSCHEMLVLSEGVDEEGYHHYVIEPTRDLVVINPT